MVAFTTTFAAFAAVAAAVPHAHQHAHFHKARNVESLQDSTYFAPLAGRSVSYDGSCGSWGGHTCPAGSCCGPNGWCGTGNEFCGTGCQTGFGECGSSASAAPVAPAAYAESSSSAAAPSSSSAPASLQVSPNGLCGEDVGYTCSGSNFGDSCSKWNYCGSNSSYSGDGCQSQYGSCDQSGLAASSDAAPQSSAPATTPSSAAQDGIHTKNPGPPAYSPPGYGGTQTTLVTKTVPAASSAAPATSAPAYSAPPAYTSPTSTSASSPPAYSAPPAYTSSSSPASSSAASPPAYSSSATSAAPSSSGSDKPALDYIKTYKGDGSTADGWPSEDDWYSFDNLWEINKPIMGATCDTAFGVENNSDEENTDIYNAINSTAASTGVDPRFILAIMMQESIGCVRVDTTVGSHDNPGLFQSNQGTGTCNSATGTGPGNQQVPCPQQEIQQMVNDGVAGTVHGPGLKQLIATCSGKGAQTYYEAARMYNSGSVAADGNLGQGVATHCYSSDIANRLTGWALGNKGCLEADVGSGTTQ